MEPDSAIGSSSRVMRYCKDRLSSRADRLFKGLHPAGNQFSLPRPIDHVDNHQQRLASCRSGSKKIPHDCVVVFLLGQYCNDHIAGITNQFRPRSMLPQGAVDVRSIEQHELIVRRPGDRTLSPDQQVLRVVHEWIVLSLPGHRYEAREERRQIHPAGHACWQAGNWVPGASSFWNRPAQLSPCQGIGQQALPGIRPAADGDDKQWLCFDLGQQLGEQGSPPGSRFRRLYSERCRQRLEPLHQLPARYKIFSPASQFGRW